MISKVQTAYPPFIMNGAQGVFGVTIQVTIPRKVELKGDFYRVGRLLISPGDKSVSEVCGNTTQISDRIKIHRVIRGEEETIFLFMVTVKDKSDASKSLDITAKVKSPFHRFFATGKYPCGEPTYVVKKFNDPVEFPMSPITYISEEKESTEKYTNIDIVASLGRETFGEIEYENRAGVMECYIKREVYLLKRAHQLAKCIMLAAVTSIYFLTSETN